MRNFSVLKIESSLYSLPVCISQEDHIIRYQACQLVTQDHAQPSWAVLVRTVADCINFASPSLFLQCFLLRSQIFFFFFLEQLPKWLISLKSIFPMTTEDRNAGNHNSVKGCRSLPALWPVTVAHVSLYCIQVLPVTSSSMSFFTTLPSPSATAILSCSAFSFTYDRLCTGCLCFQECHYFLSFSLFALQLPYMI